MTDGPTQSGSQERQGQKLSQWEAFLAEQSLSARKAARAAQGFVVSLSIVLVLGAMVSFTRGVAQPDEQVLAMLQANPVGRFLLWVWSHRNLLLLAPFYVAWEAAQEEEDRDRATRKHEFLLSWIVSGEVKELYDPKPRLRDYF